MDARTGASVRVRSEQSIMTRWRGQLAEKKYGDDYDYGGRDGGGR